MTVPVRDAPHSPSRPAPMIANAPVSYGVFGAEAGGGQASAGRLLATMAAAGYAGSELGPPGFFGSPAQTADAFRRAGLQAVGAYVPIHFSAGDATIDHDLAGLKQTCGELAACGGTGLVILADEGDDGLRRHPARIPGDRSMALDDAGWLRLARIVRRALAVAEAHQLRTSFHPHIATYVESRWEVQRLLDLTDLCLTLDTGHMLLAGADPADCIRSWRGRINHVHIKDVRVDVLRGAKADMRSDFEEWWADVSVPLGHGDVDLDAVLSMLSNTGYDGWLVVEQDRAPAPAADYARVAEQQAANHRWLASRLRAHGYRNCGA